MNLSRICYSFESSEIFISSCWHDRRIWHHVELRRNYIFRLCVRADWELNRFEISSSRVTESKLADSKKNHNFFVIIHSRNARFFIRIILKSRAHDLFHDWKIMRISKQNKTTFVAFDIDAVRLLTIIAWKSRAQEIEKRFERHANFEKKSRRYLSLSKFQMHFFSQTFSEISSLRASEKTEKTCELKLWRTIFVALISEMHTFSQIDFEISSSQVTEEIEKTCELKFWTRHLSLSYSECTFSSQIVFEISNSQVTKETEKTCELEFWMTIFVAIIFRMHAS